MYSSFTSVSCFNMISRPFLTSLAAPKF